MHTAWIYSKEGNIEHACVLDNKYTPQSSLKNFQNKETTKSAIIPEKEDVVKKLKNTGFPKAEDLKTELLKRHTKDHKQYKKPKKKEEELAGIPLSSKSWKKKALPSSSS